MLQQARRLHLAARAAIQRAEDERRRDVLGLIAEYDRLIHALMKEKKAMDLEITRMSHHARAISAYGTANRVPFAFRSAHRTPENGETLP